MVLYLLGNDYHYELENLCRLFLPQEKITVTHECPEDATGLTVTVRQAADADGVLLSVRVQLDAYDRTLCDRVSGTLPDVRDVCELAAATLLYRLLCDLFGKQQSWGLLTGVRPIKLMRRLVSADGQEAARRYFRETLLVSPEKTALAARTLACEDAILSLSAPRSFSLYISIPFCPTRCDYCSFVSQTVEKAQKLIPAYVDCLVREIAYTGVVAKRLGLQLETVYFGGGTPTTLSAEQLTRLLRAVEEHFDTSAVREYTVEAGRPDTVTEDKLRTLKAAGVSRISINPQTLREEVLQGTGRRHTVEQFYEAFDIARRTGHDNINTDLIAALPGDTCEGFARTLEEITALSPESVTVHTLSMKRASNLVIRHLDEYRPEEEAAAMTALSDKVLTAAGYTPYYLYRQGRTMGNQENVGWARPGYEGLYNVYIMDETHTILACGAGGVTKLKQYGTEYLERVFNYKFPYEYIARFDEMLRRKDAVSAFYEQYFGGDAP